MVTKSHPGLLPVIYLTEITKRTLTSFLTEAMRPYTCTQKKADKYAQEAGD